METATASAAFAGSSSDVPTPASYEDDARHFAVTASQVPKPAVSMPPLQPPPASPVDTSLRDVKSIGARFHEDCFEVDQPSPRLRSSRLFKGKGKESVAVERTEKKPLTLLDLPVDILKDIVKEVTHTNDLTSLALCHSALHRLTVPHIYSRFDIVWPDTTTHAEPRSGVDALTYGLATLVMAEEIFGEAPNQQSKHSNRFTPSGKGRATETTVRRRRGNHYAQFTRKFSLGNGPPDWVQEYLITKEGGKMLGTLVALAVARMHTLETFIWDMPTGVLRDVWLALSSLGDRNDGHPCRLEKVWVRWHDNSSADAADNMPPPLPPMNISALPLASSPPGDNHLSPMHFHPAALDRVEHPSFSVLPALKSLSVLDIDELAYLDEMAVLIGKSLDKLRELRVGIAQHIIARDWVAVWEGEGVQQVDPNYPMAAYLVNRGKRLGGVLGTLTGHVHDIRQPKAVVRERRRRQSHSKSTSPTKRNTIRPVVAGDAHAEELEDTTDLAASSPPSDRGLLHSMRSASEAPAGDILPVNPATESALVAPEQDSAVAAQLEPERLEAARREVASLRMGAKSTTASFATTSDLAPRSSVPPAFDFHDPDPPRLDRVLKLENLELERVPLSVPVLQRAFDWSCLTSLTLLHCNNHEQLWKTLRRTFAPRPKSPVYPQSRRTPTSTPKRAGGGGRASISTNDVDLEYGLNLKKVHTNTVSPSFISFLKETLAPNSLEVLFLQETRIYASTVTVDAIFRGPLRRHRGSLKKLLIDSSEKGPDGLPTSSSRWRRWMLNRDILAFLCSGKMPALRELGMAIDYRDWHFFLQRLPSIPHLRSLYIPFLADHVHGSNVDPRELALQVVDIVALRPEVELCYMGIANKCFEILENKWEWDGRPESRLGLHGHGGTGATDDANGGSEADEDDDDDDDDDADPTDEDGVGDDGHVAAAAAAAEVEEVEETESERHDSDDDSDSEAGSSEGGRHSARLRLREILFYDDKVGVFKARHGRL